MPEIKRSGRGVCPVFGLAWLPVLLLVCSYQAQAAQGPKKDQPPKAGPAAKSETPKADEGEETTKPAPGAAKKKTYRELKVDYEQKKSISWVKQVLRDGVFKSEEEGPKFEAFFKTYYLALWTQNENLSTLPVLRGNLYKEMLRPYKGNDVYKHLRDKVILPFMANLAKPYPLGNEFHPAVRVNAMLMIAELNDKEPASITDLPTPLPAAVPALLAAIEEPQQIDAVKVAAMVGILRHARIRAVEDKDVRKRLLSEMFKLVKMTDPPAGRTLEGHAWMRSQAAEILGEFGDAGAKGAVPNALAAVVADSKTPFITRCAAARALGKLNYPASGVSPTPWAIALCQLAVDACKAEPPSSSSYRQRLKDRASAALTALTGTDDQHKGIAPLMSDAAQKQLVSEMEPALQNMLDLAQNRSLDDKAVARKLVEPRDKLQELLAKQTKPSKEEKIEKKEAEKEEEKGK